MEQLSLHVVQGKGKNRKFLLLALGMYLCISYNNEFLTHVFVISKDFCFVQCTSKWIIYSKEKYFDFTNFKPTVKFCCLKLLSIKSVFKMNHTLLRSITLNNFLFIRIVLRGCFPYSFIIVFFSKQLHHL